MYLSATSGILLLFSKTFSFLMNTSTALVL